MTTLFRPVGLHELSLIWDSGMREFPPRLPYQPIFYPVATPEYAAQIAREWNTKDGSLAGYVTKFEVADSYIAKFEPHTVGSALHREYWIPAERLPEFNAALQGTIAVQSAFFGPGFQGFVADRCALKGKSVQAQFMTLGRLWRLSEADFAHEVIANRKAVYLNFLFWVQCDCASLGVNEMERDQIVRAIGQASKSPMPEIALPGVP